MRVDERGVDAKYVLDGLDADVALRAGGVARRGDAILMAYLYPAFDVMPHAAEGLAATAALPSRLPAAISSSAAHHL
jgi:hypothetical protein